MKTKKLWIWSLVFGLFATGALYFYLQDVQQSNQPVNASEDEKEEPEEEPEEELESEEEYANDLEEIEEGKRAMTVEVTDPQGVAGFVEAGSYIDVVASLVAPEEGEKEQHDAGSIVLQNVKVLAIGHAADAEEERDRYQMITVEVTPKEGLALGFASKYELYMMLRAEGDDKKEEKHLHIHEDELHEGVFIK
ncbi:hypothetical protein GCM10010954_23500 [Halobacillus andaensis]|uniref:Flp pilus assembly protein RcpC/CpaB domain-containing protein n=1 Tax=Halobacillus andaensis TaxID=1176239 RepID=A0A917EW65_HALAA|nr:Flp pilus assembly protein CpaB [Halobacillus andaensis]MBP2006059.1 pilus assembly protein CpaB [Halobacillus andaensis]GGF23906.1 hypothetical protein GCM10010954_23500 [Halobacillus andaensis]